MDNKNRDIEDFFNKSMEQFDQAPSNNVWDAIDTRLENEPSSFTKLLSIFKKGLPFILLTLATTCIIFYKNSQISKLNEEIQQLQSQTSTLSIDPKIKTSKESSLTEISKSDSSSSAALSGRNHTDENIKTEIPNSPSTRELSSKSNESVQGFKYRPTIGKEINPSTTNSKIITNSQLSRKLAFENIVSAHKTIPPVLTNNLNLTPLVSSNTKSDNVTPAFANQKTSSEKNESINTVPKLTDMDISLKTGIFEMPQLPSKILVANKDDQNFTRHLLGLSSRFCNVFTMSFKTFNGCESYGLRYEYALSQKTQLTLSTYFNIQHYDIKAPQNMGITSEILSRYSDVPLNNVSINNIELNSEYLDFLLGVKHKFFSTNNGIDFFANPSINWQVYMPQTFNFNTQENTFYRRKDHRFIGYFGSVSLRMGVEKKLKYGLIGQLSIWGEKSFVPVGIQKERLAMLGISTSILFGI